MMSAKQPDEAPGKPLENRCAIITGASQGLGLEIARKYVGAGASLMICARDGLLLHEASQELSKLAGAGQSVVALPADVSKASDVTRLVDGALAQFGRLDILVNNAGVVGPIGAIEMSTGRNGCERSGSICWVRSCCAGRSCRTSKGRGAEKSSSCRAAVATNPLPMLSAYAASKAAVIRFVETLAEETRQHHIDVNAIAPGALNTRLLDEFLAAGPVKIGRTFHERSLRQKEDGGAPLSRGAELAVFLGSALSDGITGKLISAVWDPWEALPGHLDDLNGTDVYTLRRIVQKDRHLKWEAGD